MCGAFAERYWAVGSEGRACVEYMHNYSLSKLEILGFLLKKIWRVQGRFEPTSPSPALPMSYHCATTLFLCEKKGILPLFMPIVEGEDISLLTKIKRKFKKTKTEKAKQK